MSGFPAFVANQDSIVLMLYLVSDIPNADPAKLGLPAPYDSQGQLDANFGKGGIAAAATGGYPERAVLAPRMQSNGKIITAGTGTSSVNSQRRCG